VLCLFWSWVLCVMLCFLFCLFWSWILSVMLCFLFCLFWSLRIKTNKTKNTTQNLGSKQTKQKHNTICVAHHYTQADKNNVNKTTGRTTRRIPYLSNKCNKCISWNNIYQTNKHLSTHWTQNKIPRHMTLKIQTLVCDRHNMWRC
jgi:Ca2+/Na+ antiporter